MKNRSFYTFCLLIICYSVNAQLLATDEIVSLHNTQAPSEVTDYLSQKGFIKGPRQSLPGNANNDIWVFWLTSKPEINACGATVLKTYDAKKPAETILTLYNPFHYKIFIDGLLKNDYQFLGFDIVDHKSFLVFRKGRSLFKTIAGHHYELDQSYYQITFTSEE